MYPLGGSRDVRADPDFCSVLCSGLWGLDGPPPWGGRPPDQSHRHTQNDAQPRVRCPGPMQMITWLPSRPSPARTVTACGPACLHPASWGLHTHGAQTAILTAPATRSPEP